MTDDFRLVRAKKRGKNRSERIISELCLKSIESSVSKETLVRKLSTTTTKLNSSTFFAELLSALKDSLKGSGECDILCYGLGQFSICHIAFHQLAALLAIKDKFNSVIEIYDPLFNSTEIKVLRELEFKLITENEEAKRRINPNQKTIAYFPHCAKQLTNNFLWANWNPVLENCVIIGNSFSRIIESNTKQTINECAWYIKKIQPYTEEIKLENSYQLSDVFNDLSVHWFGERVRNLDFSNALEPVYVKDSEFVRRGIETLSIENA